MSENNPHIDDDFLKNLVTLQEDEKVPDDFTQKIMSRIPKAAPAEIAPETKPWFNFRNVGILIVLVAVLGYLLFSFDIAGLFNLATETSAQNPQNYLNIITSVVEIFKQGFSGLKITSVSVTAFVALGLLFGFDKFLKSFHNGHHTTTA